MKWLLLLIPLACLAEPQETFVVNPVKAVKIADSSGNTALVNSEGQLHVVQATKYDANNSTTNLLLSGGSWTGAVTDISGYAGGVNIHVTSDVDSATKGLVVQYMENGGGWHDGEAYTFTANTEKYYSIPSWMTSYRLKYTNGGTNQSVFHIDSFTKKLTGKPSSHNVNDEIADEDDSELVISVIHAKNPSGTYGAVQRSADGNLLIHDAENPSAIAFGDVPGKSIVQKFGNAPDFDTGDGEITVTDLAEDGEPYQNMQYVYSATADITHISAENAADTQIIEVQGLGAATNLVIQSATLDGTNVVALSTPLLRVFRVKNMNSTDFADHVFVHTNGTVTAGVPDTASARAAVHNGNNQSEMSLYTVPAGKHLIVKGIYFSSAGAKKSAVYKCTLWARPAGGVFQLKWNRSFNDDLESGIQHPYQTGLYFDEGTDIELRVEILTVAVSGATISAGMEIEMKDKQP